MNALAALLLLITVPASDLDKLQGTWITVKLIDNGRVLVDATTAPSNLANTSVEYEGNQWHVKVGDKVVASGLFRVDDTKSPKELDVMDESGQINDKTKLAIYEIDGDTFRYCIARAGQPRPTEFTGAEGSGRSLITSRRERTNK